jgi:hypothetical protein
VFVHHFTDANFDEIINFLFLALSIQGENNKLKK